MKKWNLVIDVARCNNCNNCFLATKDEHVDNDFPGYAAPQPRHGHRWIDILRRERGSTPMVDIAHLPVLCNHCDDAPCIAASGGAAYKRPDGIVIIDPQRAVGKREIRDACPYGAVWWNEERRLPQIWIFDAHLLDQGWKEPRCTQVCPTGAMSALQVTDAEMADVVARDGLEVLHPEYATRPRVYYRNLDRYTKCFIGGSIAATHDHAIDCLANAQVTLTRNGAVMGEQRTDCFGDFKFDGLDAGSGAYTVEVSHPEYGRKTAEASLGESQFLGVIHLDRN